MMAIFQKSFAQSAQFYVFFSHSMSEAALLNLAKEAKHYKAILVLRGFKDQSYSKTVKSLESILQKSKYGFIVDPELFSLFNVTQVPTMILSKDIPVSVTERKRTPLHDRVKGHISILHALETFSKEGDLENDAKDYLLKGGKI